jgi:hypothetical protein
LRGAEVARFDHFTVRAFQYFDRDCLQGCEADSQEGGRSEWQTVQGGKGAAAKR